MTGLYPNRSYNEMCYKETALHKIVNPFIPNGISHRYQLEQFISVLRYIIQLMTYVEVDMECY